MRTISFFFEYLGIVILFINTFLFIKSYTSQRSMAFKYFSIYLGVCLTIVTMTSILAYLKENNLFLSHFYFIGQFVLLSLFYRELFNSIQKKIVNAALLIILSFLSFQYINNPKLFSKFNVFEIFITSFPIVGYSIIHLYNSLTKKGKFMNINAGILVYISISTLIFILGDYLSLFRRNATIKNIWFINKVLYVVYLLLILLEWKKSIKQVKNK